MHLRRHHRRQVGRRCRCLRRRPCHLLLPGGLRFHIRLAGRWHRLPAEPCRASLPAMWRPRRPRPRGRRCRIRPRRRRRRRGRCPEGRWPRLLRGDCRCRRLRRRCSISTSRRSGNSSNLRCSRRPRRRGNRCLCRRRRRPVVRLAQTISECSMGVSNSNTHRLRHPTDNMRSFPRLRLHQCHRRPIRRRHITQECNNTMLCPDLCQCLHKIKAPRSLHHRRTMLRFVA